MEKDVRIITGGATTAYLDLMVKLAQRFLGRAQAFEVARFALIDPERSSQLPYMVHLNQQAHGDSVVRKAQEILSKAPEKSLSLDELATSCGVIARTLLHRGFMPHWERALEDTGRSCESSGQKSFWHGQTGPLSKSPPR